MRERIEALLEKLTLEEKIRMIHGAGLFRTAGVERLDIPQIVFSDGPMGVRQEFEDAKWMPAGHGEDAVSYLPSNSAVAATWNRELAFETGRVLGEEARARGKDVILAPGINIKRSPLCGRNFEYLSEDPYLAGEMAVPLVKGIQTAGTAACVKHFALNNQETERLWVEVEADDRALREIYLPAFEKVIREAQPFSLMTAYNRFRGEHCCESKGVLGTILRKEWGYDGMVVSDWGGVHDTKRAAESVLDVEMSVTDNFDEYCMADPLKRAVEAGEIPQEWIDRKVRNILRMMFRLHMLGGEERPAGSYNTPEHRARALDVARESVVLLKNENGALPLDPKKVRRLLVIGDNAARIHSNGGGSAEIKALYEISPLFGLQMLLGGNTKITFRHGYEAEDCNAEGAEVNWQADSLENGGGSMGGQKPDAGELREKLRRTLREEAVREAKDLRYDAVIFIGGQNHMQDLEGHDRPDMKLPYGQDEVIAELLKVRPDLVVVMASGSPVEMPWEAEVQNLIWHWYAGMEGGTALAEVIFGRVNPSGRLPESIPFTHKDCSAHSIGEFPGGKTVAYREGIFVGYRHYDTRKIPVRFPFGYGRSYTTFAYTDLSVNVLEDGDSPRVQVKLCVKNTGTRAGAETVQIYVGQDNFVLDRPEKELRAFEKVFLEPGEKKEVAFVLGKEAFSVYRTESGRFEVEPGIYRISAGKSVEEICQSEYCTI
ncbi:beta-glucosidase [Brotaphodocola sp.]|uniref:beta-glucosidase family protein n=1 Tax=Brotaphodocola sp. TaxID=3073577 RepID=UPI003D7F14AD